MGAGQDVIGQSGVRDSVPITDAVQAALILMLGMSLAGSGDSMMRRWQFASARQQPLSFEDQLGLIANISGLIVITWWCLSLTIAVVAALLERGGRTGAATVTGKFSPAFMRRLALAAVGVQLLAAPMATAATPPDPDPLPRPAVSALWAPTTQAVEGLVVPRPLLALAHPSPRDASAAATSQAPGPASLRPEAAGKWTPQTPAVEPGALAAGQLRPQEPDGSTEMTVRAGDTLWSLAAARLGPLASDVDIASEWPRIYQANRAVIGESPHRLYPGQVLRQPPGG